MTFEEVRLLYWGRCARLANGLADFHNWIDKFDAIEDSQFYSLFSEYIDKYKAADSTREKLEAAGVFIWHQDLIASARMDLVDFPMFRETVDKDVADALVNAAFHRFIDYDQYLDRELELSLGDYIITDPCYFIKDADWTAKIYERYEFESLGISTIICNSTFYGDWENNMVDSATGKILGTFCADSGLVCIAKLDEVVAYNPDAAKLANSNLATTLRNIDGKGYIKVNRINDDEYVAQVIIEGKDYNSGSSFRCASIPTG